MKFYIMSMVYNFPHKATLPLLLTQKYFNVIRPAHKFG